MATSTHASSTMKVYKPTSPGMRGRVITRRDGLWKGKPWKALTEGIKRIGGRNNAGRTTVWHRGGGHKRVYRKVDFKRQLWDVTGNVERIEYDPNRSARIALVDYAFLFHPFWIVRFFGASSPDVLRLADTVHQPPTHIPPSPPLRIEISSPFPSTPFPPWDRDLPVEVSMKEEGKELTRGQNRAALSATIAHVFGGAMQRVKVYKLLSSGTWEDRGTGHAKVEFMQNGAWSTVRNVAQ
eukprot:jgi/Pico_ML_1/54730/g601.t2